MRHNNIVFKTPEKFTQQYVRFFLMEVENLFKMKDKQIKNVFFETKYTKEVNILGVLLIYKFLEYSVINKCFMNPMSNILNSKVLMKEIDMYGFKSMIQQFLKDKIPTDYSMSYNDKGGVFIAPMTLNRGQSAENTEVEYRKNISDYYKYDSKISFVILQCLGEIISNFSEHAVMDTKSILVASGNKDYFEIACADTGDGIVSTLGPTLKTKQNANYLIIEQALQKGVTSKQNDDHMGFGLWLIDRFADASGGEFCLFSEGGYIHRRQNKLKKGACAKWKGTIVYLRIDLSNFDNLKCVISELKNEYGTNRIQKV